MNTLRYVLRACIVVTACLFLSCSSSDDGNSGPGEIITPPPTNEWTILYYGAGTCVSDILQDGQSQTVAHIQRLERIFPSEQVHVLALLGTTVGDDHCHFMEIGFQPNDGGNELHSQELGDWGARDMSSPLVFDDFADSAVARYPANHYMLIVDGDGDGWQGSSRDEVNGNGNLLSHSGLSDVIGNLMTPDGQPLQIDLMLWLVRGMGNFEVAYEYRDVAKYVISTPSIAEQPGFAALDQWYLDLSLDPQMTSERLGEFVVSRMYQQALSAHDSLATFDLLDISQFGGVADGFNEFSNALTGTLPMQGARIITMWQQLWDERTDDSSSMDLKSFAESVIGDASFSAYPEVVEAATLVRDRLEQITLLHRTTRTGSNRDGIMIYAPLEGNPEEMSEYETLRLSQDRPGWANFLYAIQTSGPELVEASGNIRWPGHELENLYLFLNTAQFGTPQVLLSSATTITELITPDNVNFETSFAMSSDSVNAYLGAFQDVDGNGELSTGDRYGYFHQQPSPPRDWILIRSGDHLDNLQFSLDRNF